MKEQAAIKWEDQIIDILTNGKCDKKSKNYDPDALDNLMFAARELACNHYDNIYNNGTHIEIVLMPERFAKVDF